MKHLLVIIFVLITTTLTAQIKLKSGEALEGRVIQNYSDKILVASWIDVEDGQRKFWYIDKGDLAFEPKKRIKNWSAGADRYSGSRYVIGGIFTQIISAAIFTPLYIKRQDKTYIGLASGLGLGAIFELVGVFHFRRAAIKEFAQPYQVNY